MLTDCGLDLVELGHSERREHFGETDETVGLKTEAAVRHGLVPLVCIGETLAEREAGRADAVLDTQVRGALGKLSAAQRQAPLLFAYEPVWAIGVNGIPASCRLCRRTPGADRRVAGDLLGREFPALWRQVNPGNCRELIASRISTGCSSAARPGPSKVISTFSNPIGGRRPADARSERKIA